MDVHKWAAAAIVCMVGMTVFMDWVATPLNRNIKGMSVAERLPSTVIHLVIGIGFAVVNVWAIRWAIFAGAVWFTVVSAAALVNWWIPYFFDIHLGEINPDVYEQHYAHNVTVLPAFDGNPVVPDLQHTLIHMTVFASAILSWLSFARM